MRNLHGSQHRLHAGKEVGGDHDLDGAWSDSLWSGAAARQSWRCGVWHSSLSFVGNRRGQYLFENLDELMRRSQRWDLAAIIWGKLPDEKTAVEIVHQAIDGGIDGGIRDEPLNGHGEAIKNGVATR